MKFYNLGNKQGQTSRVSKRLHAGCYEFSYQLSLYSEISLATPFSFEFTIEDFLSFAMF